MERKVIDPKGNPIGVLSLYDDIIPRTIMDGGRFYLAGSYSTFPKTEFLSFMILPVPSIEATKKPLTTYRTYMDPESGRFKIEMIETTTLLDTDNYEEYREKQAELIDSFTRED